jgi:hypothetical protein
VFFSASEQGKCCQWGLAIPKKQWFPIADMCVSSVYYAMAIIWPEMIAVLFTVSMVLSTTYHDSSDIHARRMTEARA